MNTILESMMSLHRCEDCPMRCQAAKKPKSILARMHRWHMRWWPGWQIYQAELRAQDLRARKINAAARS